MVDDEGEKSEWKKWDGRSAQYLSTLMSRNISNAGVIITLLNTAQKK